MKTATRCWECPYCSWLIELAPGVDLFTAGCDHMLDEHRERLITERPVILHSPRETK